MQSRPDPRIDRPNNAELKAHLRAQAAGYEAVARIEDAELAATRDAPIWLASGGLAGVLESAVAECGDDDESALQLRAALDACLRRSGR